MTITVPKHSAVPFPTQDPVLSSDVFLIVKAVPINGDPASIGKDTGIQTSRCEWRQGFNVTQRTALAKAAGRGGLEAIPVCVTLKRKVRPNYEQYNGGQNSHYAQAGDEDFFLADMVLDL